MLLDTKIDAENNQQFPLFLIIRIDSMTPPRIIVLPVRKVSAHLRDLSRLRKQYNKRPLSRSGVNVEHASKVFTNSCYQ